MRDTAPMPRRPGAIGTPADAFDAGGFPDGAVRPDATPGAVELAAVARRLRSVLDDTGEAVTHFAERTGVDRTTIYDLFAGRAYLDVVTLARLERGAGTRLWPDPEISD